MECTHFDIQTLWTHVIRFLSHVRCYTIYGITASWLGYAGFTVYSIDCGYNSTNKNNKQYWEAFLYQTTYKTIVKNLVSEQSWMQQMWFQFYTDMCVCLFDIYVVQWYKNVFIIGWPIMHSLISMPSFVVVSRNLWNRDWSVYWCSIQSLDFLTALHPTEHHWNKWCHVESCLNIQTHSIQ